jgi:hypothetical protein
MGLLDQKSSGLVLRNWVARNSGEFELLQTLDSSELRITLSECRLGEVLQEDY